MNSNTDVMYIHVCHVLCSVREVLQEDHCLKMYSNYCLLSLWRVARGSKLMCLELIHGLFIT